MAVGSHVGVQVGSPVERLVALGAHERFHLKVFFSK